MQARGDFLGVPLDLHTMDEAVERCVELVEADTAVQHVVVNAGKTVMMHDDPALKRIVAACDLIHADGQSVVWAGRFLGLDIPERVAGIDLMERLLGEAERRGWPVFFLGARPEALDAFVAVVRQRHGALRITGYRDGYFDDDRQVAAQVRDSGARLLFVGISSPRKERFLAENLEHMGPVLAMGVGGSFDVWAGLTRRAPVWMQRAGLEWFYRLVQEPRRMWRRYLVGNTRFVLLVLRERLRAARRS